MSAMRRLWFAAVVAAAAFGQTPTGDPQQPSYQPGWPCTGKERSFDPTYAKISEATGGHLFLFDKSEISGMSTLAIGDMNHKQTIARAAGKTDSYVDIPFYVDSTVESLFVIASLRCMQTIYLYDPQRTSVGAATAGVSESWFRAGRITTVPAPQPGQWILRLLGTGSYFTAIEAKSSADIGEVTLKDGNLTVWLDSAIPAPRFRLVRQTGEPLTDLALAADPSQPSRHEAHIELPAESFRVQAEWTAENGEIVERTEPRLNDGKASISSGQPGK